MRLDGGPARLRMAAVDRESALVWLLSRVTVVIAAIYGSWVFTGRTGVFIGDPGELEPQRTPLTMWDQWDVGWYRDIARLGYSAPGLENNPAFLPGLPMLMRGFHALGLEHATAGLLISLVAGLVASIALGRLTQHGGGEGQLGVLAWVCAPMAVYLAAPYTESLFAALGFWAWYLARRDAWVWAAVLAALATLVRVNGLFLALALIVLLVTRHPTHWRRGLALVLPFVAAAGYVTYLHAITGSWSTWFDVQKAGWGREFTSPVDALITTYQLGFTDGLAASFAIQYRFEMGAVVVMLAFGLILLARRHWAEATYVLLTLAALVTSSHFFSVPRAMLTLFPVWVLIGIWMTRRRWFMYLYLAVCAPAMVVGVIAYVNGRWVA